MAHRAKDIVGIGMTSFFSQQAWVRDLLKLAQLHGACDFLRYLYCFGIAKINNLVGSSYKGRRFFSMRRLVKNYNIPIYKVNNPNDPKFLSFLRTLNLDVILCQTSHLLSKELLSIPKNGCINRHSSLLPKYRGLYPVFWAMLNGEEETGVTVHMMGESIDSGSIICQERVKIYDDDTCYKIYHRTFVLGAKLVLEALEKIENGLKKDERIGNWQDRYYSFPTRDAIRKFRKLGKKFGAPLI